jgi:hypothetical protein
MSATPIDPRERFVTFSFAAAALGAGMTPSPN